MKQLHPDFNNLFLQMYRHDENEITKKIIFIDHDDERFELKFNESESVILKDFMQRYGLEYNLFNIKNDNNLAESHLVEHA